VGINTESNGPVVSRRLSGLAALAIGVGAAGVAYLVDRKFDRWWKQNHPLAGAKARVERTKTTYRNRRDFAVEAATVAGELFAEISRATASKERTNPPG
jgi:hypothetical protein